MCSMLKCEFQVKNLKYEDCEADQFYKSQWTNNRWAFVTFKLVLLVYWITFLVIGLVSYEDLHTWWTKLTSWGVVTILLYLISSTTLAILGPSLPQTIPSKDNNQKLSTISSSIHQTEALERNNNIIPSPSKSDLRWCHKIVWILFEVSCGVAFTITVSYWSLLEVRLSPFSFNNHLINSIIMLLELTLNRIPVKILHFYNLFSFSVIYVVFSLILHGAGFSSAVYPVLDWEQNWKAALGLAIGVIFLVSPLVHLFVFGLYSLRKFVASKLLTKYAKPLDTYTSKSFSNKSQLTGEVNPSYQV